jgi:uncharacterized protein YndB with AHSA1/START domain
MVRSGSDPEFDFISKWQLSTDRETVWQALVDFQSWPEWWPGLVSVEETAQGGDDGIGQRATSHWRGPLGYSIEFEIETTDRTFPGRLAGRATGDLAGLGTWLIGSVTDPEPPEGTWTQIVYEWNVVMTRKWMQLLNPVARPAFVHAHDYVMEQGAEGLAQHLNCEIRGFAKGEADRN